jgi:chromosome partitioning protein
MLFSAPQNAVPLVLESGISLLVGHQGLDQLDQAYHEPSKIKQLMEMRERIRALPYDMIIIDTPPAIGVRQVAPILWADGVIAVIEPSGLALAGLATFTRTVEQIKQLIKRPIALYNVVNRYNKTSRKQRELLEQVEREGRLSLLQPYLSNRVAVADALTEGKPVWDYAGVDAAVKEEWQAVMRQLLAPALLAQRVSEKQASPLMATSV